MRKSLSFVISVMLGLLLVPALLLAQGADPLVPPDFKALGTSAILALTPVLGVLILWGVKLAWSKVPASVLLFAAPVLGIVVNYGLAYLASHVPGDPLLAAVFGALAVYLHEIGTTLSSKGVSGGVTITKAMF